MSDIFTQFTDNSDSNHAKLQYYHNRHKTQLDSSELYNATGTSSSEIKPSIETAANVANALGVTLDYLVKYAEYQNIHQNALERLNLQNSKQTGLTVYAVRQI